MQQELFCSNQNFSVFGKLKPDLANKIFEVQLLHSGISKSNSIEPNRGLSSTEFGNRTKSNTEFPNQSNK